MPANRRDVGLGREPVNAVRLNMYPVRHGGDDKPGMALPRPCGRTLVFVPRRIPSVVSALVPTASFCTCEGTVPLRRGVSPCLVFHGPANFMNIKFTPRRVKGIGQSHDAASWKNSSLDRYIKRDKRWPYPKFRCEEFIQPIGWIPIDTVGSYQRHPGSDSNWYVTLEYGPGANLRQYYCSKDAVRLKAFFRARGKGRLHLWTGGFETTPDGKDYRGNCKTSFGSRVERVERVDFDFGMSQMVRSAA